MLTVPTRKVKDSIGGRKKAGQIFPRIDWLSSSSSSERKTASKPAGRPPSRPLHKFGFRGIEHISNVIYLVRRRNFGGAGDRAKLEYLKTRLILSSTSHRRPEEKSGLNQFLQLVGTIIKKSRTVIILIMVSPQGSRVKAAA